MGFLSNFIRTSLAKKCPDGYRPAGVTKEGIVYYEKIKKDVKPEKLSANDKKRIMVQQVTTEDMLQFPNIPYQLNCPVHKQLAKNSHPFAYMDLNEFNQTVAKRDLKMVNGIIADARKYIRLLSSDICIRMDRISYKDRNDGYGYTRIMCTPKTFTGKISKYPISLFFMAKNDASKYSAHGELFYEKNGKIEKGGS